MKGNKIASKVECLRCKGHLFDHDGPQVSVILVCVTKDKTQ